MKFSGGRLRRYDWRGGVCCALLVAGMVVSSATPAANRLYKEDFETADGWKTYLSYGSVLSVKRVTAQPRSGSGSLRGNFNPSITDPVTGLKGVAGTPLALKLPNLKNQTPNGVYMSFWLRFDKCSWGGSQGYEGPTGGMDGKFSYMVNGTDPAQSFYPVMKGGATGLMQLGFNSSGTDWESWVTRNGWPSPKLWDGNTGKSWGPDGLWHQYEISLEYGSTKSYMTMWVDGKPASFAAFRDGRIPMPPNFHMSEYGFFYVPSQLTDRSQPNGESCNGWQLDDLEVWDGKPGTTTTAAAPKPPAEVHIE